MKNIFLWKKIESKKKNFSFVFYFFFVEIFLRGFL